VWEIKRADLEERAASANDLPKPASAFVADELKKLAELRDAGILSAAEFQRQKSRLLGGLMA
jgi:predicted Zn-dependent peptidase